MKVYILCAAIHYQDGDAHPSQPENVEFGFVIGGRRHHNIINTIDSVLNISLREQDIQGFITNTNMFVNRQEAYKIAFEADQIIGPNKGCPTNEIGLTSEDLY